MMGLKLYGTVVSPPARAVLMCAQAIGLKLELVEVDLFKGEHLKPKFLKINPLHTVPVLDDNGFILVDSHAIMAYLVDTYAKDASLYPTDVKKRARINQLLHFDSGTLFPKHLRNAVSMLFDGATAVAEENKKAVTEAFGFAETFLENTKFIAGDNLSIADISVFTTISNASVLVPFNKEKYPKITAWQKTVASLPFYSIDKKGREMVLGIVEAKLSK